MIFIDRRFHQLDIPGAPFGIYKQPFNFIATLFGVVEVVYGKYFSPVDRDGIQETKPKWCFVSPWSPG